MTHPHLVDPWSAPAEPPRKLVRKLTEKKIQAACVAYARRNGYWARKFASPSQRSVPDYLFGKHWPNGHSVKWAEEFKAPGKHPSENQEEEQAAMREAGWHVLPETGTNGQADIDAFKARIDAIEKTYG